MKHTDCPDCGGTGLVKACAKVYCDRPALGKCVGCRTETCSEHGRPLYGVPLCFACFETATVADVDRAAKVSA
jgi:hypothetical protein